MPSSAPSVNGRKIPPPDFFHGLNAPVSTKLFGTDGIRGKANEYPITAEVALRVGQAVAALLTEADGARPRVLIGRDTRASGGMLQAALGAGLMASGVDVLVPGPLPTPAIAYLTRTLGCAAGVMLTASHNPYEDNGIKIFGPDGYKLSDALEAAVEAIIHGDLTGVRTASPERIGVTAHLPDGAQRYIDFAKASVPGISLAGKKIVLDCGHGAAYRVGPQIFRELGAEVIAVSCEPDGRNINEGCGALHPEAIAGLVREHGADLGISFDGDADRVIFTDGSGTPISGDRILALSALALQQQGTLRGNAMACTVMSNLGLHEAMKKAGIRVITTAVGDRHVLEALRREDCAFGGENSGHLIFTDHATTGDGIMSALQILGMMQRTGESLADLAGCMQEYPQQLLNLKVAAKPPLTDLPKLQALMAEADAAFTDQGRHLIRYSGTENKIRILVEHRDAAAVTEWVDRFRLTILEEIGSPA
jgi:phosphoglucosamine mutase